MPKAPELEFIFELKVLADKPELIAETENGIIKKIAILGGTFEGPKIKGNILAGGADQQLIRKDGVTELEAKYDIISDDDIVISIIDRGLRIASAEVSTKIALGQVVDEASYYFRTNMKFIAPKGKYDWLNKAIFITKGAKKPDHVSINVWKVN